ncbi:claudin-4 [Austrofundulus limnaeus]|uniref:Claudin-4 n=1 Tax=Austrofundulus limnaeus TaxID=52670 RepID=A0A2I4CXM3_AUSLI|nr:PREDICTED: claudin-4-like [Austrofundulus limnaeus]
MAQRRETAGLVLGSVGLVLAAVTCGTPMWTEIVYIETCNWGGRPTTWEGLWMSCWVFKSIQNRCYPNKPEMMSQDMQAARAMTSISIVSGVFGVVLSIIAKRCTKFFKEDQSKSKASVVSGVFFILSGLLCCISVSWHATTILTEPYELMSRFLKKSEMGAALYVGWAATPLLLVGGGLLVWSCPPRHGFTHVTSASTSRGPANGLPASEETLSLT